MLLPDNDRGRPAANQTASNVISDGDNLSVAKATDLLADLDALAEHLRGYFVVQVVVSDAGHRRTYIYRTTLAAERAVERARARGRHATITLCQLHPVGVVAGVVR